MRRLLSNLQRTLDGLGLGARNQCQAGDASEYQFMADTITKFFNSVRVEGWFHHPTDRLRDVSLIDPHQLSSTQGIGLRHDGVIGLGPDKGFFVQSIRNTTSLDQDVLVRFETEAGWTRTIALSELSSQRRSLYSTRRLTQRFYDLVSQIPDCKVLDIGGRARSKLDRSRAFSNAQVTVLDVLPGENVDVVADAHAMASVLPHASFDCAYSISVFEHLLMPWVVAQQLNQVLKTGGVAFVATHQTLGMHDIPWDFWRFSNEAWKALFNPHTGFQIIETSMCHEQYILPFVFRPERLDAERSAGFEASAVLVRKIGPCRMSWPLTCKDVIDTQYPDHDDGQKIPSNYI